MTPGRLASNFALGVHARQIRFCGALPHQARLLASDAVRLHITLAFGYGRLIAQAAQRSQVLVVSHAARLIATLEREAGCESLVLDKQLGATGLVDADTRDLPAWKWPSR